jgi:hypothetical protein
LSYHHLFATYTATKRSGDKDATTPSSNTGQANTILLWDYQNLEDGTETLVPLNDLNTLPSRVAHIIGAFGPRLVLYTTDHWIASVELQQAGSPGSAVIEGYFVRHFFLPNDWVGSMVVSNMIFGIGRGGEIFLARRSELAVIKRGLEVTEDGGTFHPRRLNNSIRTPSGGRIPYRHRAQSSTS